MTTPIEMTCLIAGGGGRLLELAGQLTRSRKSSGPPRRTALQQGQESGSVRTFAPALDAPGQQPWESSGQTWPDTALAIDVR